MKNINSLIPLVFLFLSVSSVHSQTGVNTQTPEPSSALDTYSLNKGILFPRMTTAQKLAINLPAEGLMVYDTSLHSHYIFINGSWVIQRKQFVYPQRNFLIAQSATSIGTPTTGTDNENNDARFDPVSVPMTQGTVSGPAIFTNTSSLTIAAAGKYLFKISTRFAKNGNNNALNMKARTILLVNNVNILNTWFHLPNAVNASSTKTNFIVRDLAVGDVITVQVKKDRFASTSTASAGLNATFSDVILELEKLPVVN